MNWKPPKSPHGLLQEQLWKDPWKIFVCCIFCNLTKRVQAEPFFRKVISKWPSAEALSVANHDELESLIKPLGLSSRRAKALTHMSKDYLTKEWKDDPTRLYGIGKYGSDAYFIFCVGKWKEVQPKDGALINYQNYLKQLYK